MENILEIYLDIKIILSSVLKYLSSLGRLKKYSRK